MANPAAEARAKVKAAHPEAVVVERGRTSIKHSLADTPEGRHRFALDVSIGPLHYGPGNDQEIDTALVPSTVPWDWEMTKAGFEVRALSGLSAGQVIEYRSGSEWVRFQPMALQYSNDLDQIQPISMPGNVQAEVADDTLTWADGYGPGLGFSYQAQTARLAKLLTIQSPTDLPTVDQFILDGGNPVLELNLIFAFSSGVTPYVNGQEWKRDDRDTQGLVEFRDDQGNVLWWFNLPRSWDAEGNEQLGTFRFKKQGNSLYVSHRVPLAFVQGAAYPLRVDVTIDEQVGASADDSYNYNAGSVDHTSPYILMGNFAGENFDAAGYRFTGVVISDGVTIDVAYLSFRPFASDSGAIAYTWYGADLANPPTFTTTEPEDITTTTASVVENPPVNWTINVWVDSLSLVGIVQELEDSYDYSSGSAMAFVAFDGGGSGERLPKSWDNDTALAAKLHIEYTAAGIGADEMMAAIGQQTGGGGGSGDIMAHSRKPPEAIAY